MKAMTALNIIRARRKEIRLLFLLVFLMLMDERISLESLNRMKIGITTRL